MTREVWLVLYVGAIGAALGLLLGQLVGHGLLSLPRPVALAAGVALGATVPLILAFVRLRRLRDERRARPARDEDDRKALQAWAERRGFTRPSDATPQDLGWLQALPPHCGDHTWEARHRVAGQLGGRPFVMLDATLREFSMNGYEREEKVSLFMVVAWSAGTENLPRFELIPQPWWVGVALEWLGLRVGVLFDAHPRFGRLYRLLPTPTNAIRVREGFTSGVLRFFAANPGWHVISLPAQQVVFRRQDGCPPEQRDDFLARAGEVIALFQPAEGGRAREVVPGKDRLDERKIVLAGFTLTFAFLGGFGTGAVVGMCLIKELHAAGWDPWLFVLPLVLGLGLLGGVLALASAVLVQRVGSREAGRSR